MICSFGHSSWTAGQPSPTRRARDRGLTLHKGRMYTASNTHVGKVTLNINKSLPVILSDLAQASPPASTRTKPHSHQGPEIPPLQGMQVLVSNPCPTHGLINTRDENLYSLTGSGIEDIWEELKMAVLF